MQRFLGRHVQNFQISRILVDKTSSDAGNHEYTMQTKLKDNMFTVQQSACVLPENMQLNYLNFGQQHL